MELISVGTKNNIGYKIPVYLNDKEEFNPYMGCSSRFCIIFMESGNGVLSINSEHLYLTSPCIICLNETETVHLVDNNSIKARSIYFHPSFVNGVFNFDNVRNYDYLDGAVHMDMDWFLPFIKRDMKYKGLIHIGPGTASNISILFGEIYQQICEQNDFFWPCRSRTYFFELLFQIYRLYLERDMFKDIPVQSDDPLVKQIITYITLNYKDKITLETISDIFHTNRTTVGENFFRATGMTIKKYIINVRVCMASAMLRDSLLPIEEIAERIGFSDATHFGRVIKKHTGFTPSEYRDKYCSMR